MCNLLGKGGQKASYAPEPAHYFIFSLEVPLRTSGADSLAAARCGRVLGRQRGRVVPSEEGVENKRKPTVILLEARHSLALSEGQKENNREEKEGGITLWENELIMFRFAFLLLIGIFLLLLVSLIKSHMDHRELIDVLASLRAPGCQEETEASKKKPR